jgi:23S rRNA maturation mini-RNase III
MALLGDAVYELLLREVLLAMHAQHPLPWRTLVQLKNHGAKAETQTQLLHTLLETVTDEATANLVRRGRNLSHTGRKRSDQASYRQATALEVLVGVWWQQGNQQGLAHLKTLLATLLTL